MTLVVDRPTTNGTGEDHLLPGAPAPDPTRRLGVSHPLLLRRAAIRAIEDGRLPLAERLLAALLGADPEDAASVALLASLHDRRGDPEGARTLYDRATNLAPHDPGLLSSYIFAADRDPSVTLADAYALRRRYHDLVADRLVRWPFANDRDPDRRLRVGYVSGDFRNHSAAYSFAPVLAFHDRAQVETYAYATSPGEDWLTRELQAAVPHWRVAAGLDDRALYEQIRADQIDVLVDLSGHSGGNRLPVFAMRAAPVQVTAWGYITGTGLDQMDYLIADRDTISGDEEQFYAEQVIRVERILAYAAPHPDEAGPVQPAPHLRNGYLTFGVFQRLGKLRVEAIRLWCRVLDAVPDALLVVKAPGLDEPAERERIQALFAAAGADLGRLEFRGSTSHAEHLRAYGLVDVNLDPWPDGGGISTLDAAYMGVPTLTLPHHQIPSRVSASVARELGFHWAVADSSDDYVLRARTINDQRTELAAIREITRDLLLASAFCDAPRYARSVELAYREIWRRWALGPGYAAAPSLTLKA